MLALADLTFPAVAWELLVTLWPTFVAVASLQGYALRGRVSGSTTLSFAVSFGFILSWFLTWVTSIAGTWWTAPDHLVLGLSPFWYWQLCALAVSLAGFGIATAIALLVDRQRLPVQAARVDVAMLETIVVVIPALAIWSLCLFSVLVSPVFPDSDIWEPPAGSAYFRAAAGFAGAVALWVSGSPACLTRIRLGPMWCAIGLLVGIAASFSVIWSRHAGTLNVEIPLWLPYVLLLPMGVAIRRLSQIL